MVFTKDFRNGKFQSYKLKLIKEVVLNKKIFCIVENIPKDPLEANWWFLAPKDKLVMETDLFGTF